LPSGTVGNGVQQPPRMIHVIRIARRDQLPAVPGRISCRNIKRGSAALRRDGAARAALWLEATRARARLTGSG